MAKTEADICNVALLRVGERQTISSLTDANAQAIACNVLYPQARDTLLTAFPWPFAERHAVLPLLTTTRTGWACMYQLPADCLVARYVSNGVRPGAAVATESIVVDASVENWNYAGPWFGGYGQPVEFAIEASDDGASRVLLTDQGNAELIYTAAVTVVPLFPALFVDAVAWALAADLAMALPNKASLENQLRARAQAAFSRAAAASLNGEKEDPYPDSATITVRN